MPLLLYCALLAAEEPTLPEAGIAGKAVARHLHDAVVYWYSELTDQELARTGTRESALQCHQVVEAAFAVTTVVPFRFPTAISSFAELDERHEAFRRELERLRGLIQMEVRIAPAAELGEANTGTEYLRARQSALHAVSSAAETTRQATADVTHEWRQRGTQTGIRCFALVSRSNVESFRGRIAATSFAPDVRIRASGPWPPTVFIDPMLNGDKV